MLDELLLLSGNDIPFFAAKATIHQPRIREIAYVNEEKFWPGCQLFKFSKDLLQEQDKIGLSNQSNFNIIMSMIQDKNVEAYKAKINVLSVLALMFPTCEIKLDGLIIRFRNQQTNEEFIIDEKNFEQFKQILIQVFCLTSSENKQYNPSGDLAKKIADKIMQGRRKKAELAPDNQKIAILSRYISILAVGQKKDMNQLLDYTVYQLMDEYNRFILKTQYDTWMKFKIAGADGLDDPVDWYKDIHSNNDKDELIEQ